MGLCVFLGNNPGRAWMREWGLGFSILAALAVAFIAHTTGASAA